MAMKPQLSLAKKKAAARARRPDKQKNAVDLAAVYERLTHRVGLLDKHEVTAVAGTSFKTIWEWMRASKFPRSRVVAGKSKWPAADIADWLDGLPVTWTPRRQHRSALARPTAYFSLTWSASALFLM